MNSLFSSAQTECQKYINLADCFCSFSDFFYFVVATYKQYSCSLIIMSGKQNKYIRILNFPSPCKPEIQRVLVCIIFYSVCLYLMSLMAVVAGKNFRKDRTSVTPATFGNSIKQFIVI